VIDTLQLFREVLDDRRNELAIQEVLLRTPATNPVVQTL
jgi:hypothetical protein